MFNRIKKLARGIISAIKILLNPKSVQGQTYYPEKQRKKNSKIFFEQLFHALKCGEFNKYYYVYGIDVVGKKDWDYMDYYSFIKLRDGRNMTQPYSFICLLRDKRLFGIIASAYGLQTASNVATIHDGISSEPLDVLLTNNNHLFCKPVDALCGNGVFELLYHDNEYYVDKKKISKDLLLKHINALQGDYIVQPFIEQHEDISAIYEQSLNTIRIVTVNVKNSSNPDDVIVLAKLLRMGVNGLNVDNWAKGGVVVGINDDGRLMKYGFYKPGYGTKTEKHPNSGIVFEGRKIPMYDEMIKQVKFFHSKLNGIHSIGWDVAVTNNGPVFIEGNDNYELGFLQACFGGMRNCFYEYFK